MKKETTFTLATVAGVFLAGSAAADVLLFDLSAGRADFDAELVARNKEIKASPYDLTGQFGDPGVISLDGPVGLDGTEGKMIDSNVNAHGVGGRNGRGVGGSGLAVIGVSAGFGNSETALLANFFVDSFDFLVPGELQTAAEFSALSVLGSNTVDITVYAQDDVTVLAQFTGLRAPSAGNRYGLVSDDSIGRINIYDAQGGAEGIMGTGAFYQTIPAPGALALLGAAGVLGRRRRR